MKALLVLLVFYSYFPSFSRPPSHKCQDGYRAVYKDGGLYQCVRELNYYIQACDKAKIEAQRKCSFSNSIS